MTALYRPLIGLSTYQEPSKHGIWDVVSSLLPATYADGVTQAGGRPVLLPPVANGHWTAEELADLDGVILTGGADVDPRLYGQDPLSTTGKSQPGRDAAELDLVAAADRAGLPLLGICRGAQVLNVARGGTLHQHAPDVVGNVEHLVSLGDFHANEVKTEPGSHVADVLGEAATVNCHHHQSLDQLGTRLRVTAVAPDGTIEAVEGTEPGRFVLAVQWHPEENLDDLRIFTAIVEAARARHLALGQAGPSTGSGNGESA